MSEGELISHLYNGICEAEADNFWNIDNCESSYSF
jgi:hypothetical protein